MKKFNIIKEILVYINPRIETKIKNHSFKQ